MGVQACRLPAPKRLKRLKRLKPLKLAKAFRNAQPRRHKLSQGQIHRFFWTVQELPQGQIHRFFWAVQFAKRSQPTGTPRPHQWLLMGVQACRLPAPKRLKRLQRLKCLKPLKLVQKRFGTPNRAGTSYPKARSIAFSGQCKSYPTRPDPSLLLGGPACRSPFAANRHPKATSMASYGRPSLPFASP